MTLLRPTARLTFDGRALSGPEAASAEALVECSVGGALDRATVTLSAHSPVVDVAPGAELTIALGRADDLTDVFAGTVVACRRTPHGALVEALSAVALVQARVGRSFVRQSVAEIASGLIEAGGGRAGALDAPMQLSAFHVDERRSVWRHLQQLAGLAAAELRCEADGSVSITAVRRGAAAHVLRAGSHLLGWEAGAALPLRGAPDVVPSRAASEAGADRWQQLLAEPDGGSPSRPTVVPAAVSTREAARSLAEGLAGAAARRTADGWLVATGNARIRAGHLVEVEDLPGGDRTWRVLDAQHVLDVGGFRSRLRLEAA